MTITKTFVEHNKTIKFIDLQGTTLIEIYRYSENGESLACVFKNYAIEYAIDLYKNNAVEL